MQIEALNLSVILPCLNEKENIGKLIGEILLLGEDISEILVIDDGSTDGTDIVVTAWLKMDTRVKLLRTPVRLGLARSIHYGIVQSNSEFVAVMDTDGMHNPVYLKLLGQRAQTAKGIAVASRYVKGGAMKGALYPHLSQIVNRIVKIMTRSSINDQLCGFFVADRKLLCAVPETFFDGFGEYFIRVLGHLEALEVRIEEIGTVHEVRSGGKRKSKRLKMLREYLKTAISVSIYKHRLKLNLRKSAA